MKPCKTCEFWKSLATKEEYGKRVTYGECRRYAPRVLSGSGAGYYIQSLWATTVETDGCGEHKEREVENVPS